MAALSSNALPGLLVQLHLQSFEGWLSLQRGATVRRFLWQGGTPTRLESTEDADALIERLIRAGTADEEARTTFRREAARKPASELVVLVGMKAAGPKDLLAALGQQLREVLLDCAQWDAAEVEMEPEPEPGPALSQAPLDVLAVAAEAVARFWRPDEVLQRGLGDHATHFPCAVEGLDELRDHLPAGAGVDALREGLNGEESAFNLLRHIADPNAYAAIWLLQQCGAIAWSTTSAATKNPEAEVEAAPEPELPDLEIVVAGKPEEQARGGTRSGSTQKALEQDRKAADLRDKILDLHGRLKNLDHWELLGVDRETPDPKIKKAYLKLAKRLHPDKAAQLGLEHLKTEANELFAAITLAHETLSDPDQRRAYEATLDGHTAVDANMLAQAEMLFQKGEVMMRAGNFLDAHEYLEAAVELWPEEADYQAALAWTLFKKSPPEDERSVEHFERALELNGDDALNHLRFSVVLKAVGQKARSETEAATARKLDPGVRV